MNRIFRTFFIFLLLLSARSTVAEPLNVAESTKGDDSYSARQVHSKNLDGLTAIPSAQLLPCRQSSANLDTLFQRAHQAQQELSQLLQDIAQHTQTHVVLPPLKSYQRAQDKVAAKFKGDASQITDLARASLVAESIYDLMSAFEQLQFHTQMVQIKNRFAEPKASGYRDLNLLVQLPNSRMIVEVQLHLSAIAAIKSGAEHQTYEQVQAIERRALLSQRPLSEFELAHIAKLRQTSHKQYHKAWLSYKRTDSGRYLPAASA